MEESNKISFDPAAKKLVLVSKDNRVRIWDVATAKLDKELSESTQLTTKYTCASWSSASPTPRTPKQKHKSNDGNFVALGTYKGAVHVWNLVTDEITHTFDEKKGLINNHVL